MNFKFLSDSPWRKRRDSFGGSAAANNLFKSPRSKTQNNSDRFIPCRIHDNLAGLLMQPTDEPSQILPANPPNYIDTNQKDEAHAAKNHYSALLEAHIINDFDNTNCVSKEKFSASQQPYKTNTCLLKYKKFKR